MSKPVRDKGYVLCRVCYVESYAITPANNKSINRLSIQTVYTTIQFQHWPPDSPYLFLFFFFLLNMTSSSSSSPEMHPAPPVDSAERFSYKLATHEEVLEDLSSRFLLNLPEEELSSLERICFQVEQAHWFYEDFIREQNPKFPSLPLKKFSAMLFQACPLLHQWSHDHEQAFNTFMQYKTRVPVCGAIMLNDTWEKCILVKGWKSSSGWGFPKGKINESEPTHECAIREVLEETGYNLAGQLNPANVIEMSIKEQRISLFVVPGVPEDFPFKTRTRKEISRIEWFKLTDLPTWRRNKAAPGKFYLISPFIASLKAFVTANKPRAMEGRARKTGGYTSTDNGTHESSSSSADNGEPQTPSPQYSEALPATGRCVATHESDDGQVVDAEHMDPHFARLLSSLTLSAVKQDDSKPQLVLPPVKSPLSMLAHNATPLAKQNIVDWSSRVSAHSETPVISSSPPKQRLSSVSSSSTHPLRVPQSSSMQASYVESSILPTSPSHVPGTPSSGALSTASLSAASSTSSFTSSRKVSLSSRRTSSTADISPYLPRLTEVPASGKTLRQLALLEAVADESSRMTPTLPSRELPTMTNFGNASGVRHPGPSASVPPPTHYPQAEFRPLFGYTPSMPAGYHLPSTSHHASTAYSEPPLVDDVFQVRPRSSQFVTHDYSPRNTQQNQLLSLLTGPPPLPVGMPHTSHPHPSYLQGYLPAHHYQPHPSAHFPPAHQAAGPHMVTGLSTAMLPTTFHPLPIPSRTPVTNSAQLLSLLNDDYTPISLL
ncbi:DCP2-domain-containing protein [Suillus clintonianus]|uniref:DCP2-domain-containing protein n=1 Tax=Suillus clintonianus TaxID=1904413 RepID=UPI001B863280|nr:DCP2-domain-containing protein [Suillus clintonianus]KAG2154854.1 DCP2-domain-containing protein [Suillus clintonianus]